jgi:hypothetical protein
MSKRILLVMSLILITSTGATLAQQDKPTTPAASTSTSGTPVQSRKPGGVVGGVVIVPCSVSAKAKPAWEWTLDERLAERFDPAKIQERDEAYVSMYGAAHPELRSKQTTPRHTGTHLQYGIDGRRNPELFLPHELFESLVRSFTPDASRRTRTREGFAAGLRCAGFDPDSFWSALEPEVVPYLKWQDRQGGMSGSEVYEKCRARHDALEAARQLFGAARFDKMLYTVVAPIKQFSTGTTFPNPSEELRNEANGCQNSTRPK